MKVFTSALRWAASNKNNLSSEQIQAIHKKDHFYRITSNRFLQFMFFSCVLLNCHQKAGLTSCENNSN